VGTNLSMVRLADEAERWLGKPVLAINAATLWHALRSNGIGPDARVRLAPAGALIRDGRGAARGSGAQGTSTRAPSPCR